MGMSHRNDNVFAEVMLALSVIALLGWAAVRVVESVKFEQAVGGHLKRAADANNLAIATHELESALYGMDARRLCGEPGYTSVLWRTPDEDVGFWCDNIAATLDDVAAASGDLNVDHLTESNMLIKVRETLLDHGEGGDRVTVPSGISVYPSNGAFAWWGMLSLVIALATGIVTFVRRVMW